MEPNNYGIYYSYYDLQHFGVKGRSGRYPYGSGDRPYQDKERSKGKRGGIGEYIRKRRENKEAKAKEELIKEQDQRRRQEERFKSSRETVVNRGSASEALEYHRKFGLTNQELQTVVSRLDWEAKLKSADKKAKEAGFNKMNDIMDKVGKVTNWTDTGIRAWNDIAAIYNSTSYGKESPLTSIKKGDSGDKDKKK